MVIFNSYVSLPEGKQGKLGFTGKKMWDVTKKSRVLTKKSQEFTKKMMIAMDVNGIYWWSLNIVWVRKWCLASNNEHVGPTWGYDMIGWYRMGIWATKRCHVNQANGDIMGVWPEK